MRIGFLDELPQFPMDIYKTVKKSGSRLEYSIKLSDDLIHLGSKISSMPLKFASLVKALPSSDGQHQDFHADSKDGERAIVYLTNVEKETNGPIEFKEYGKIMGKAGTFVHYSANEIHRGCSSDIERYALALAFDNTSKRITTIGAHPCSGVYCEAGYELLDPANFPETEPYDSTTCCQLITQSPTNDAWKWILIVVASIVFLYWLDILV
jgi:hypothetical protein